VKSEKCVDFECFKRNILSCSKASFISEKDEASWGYQIVGKRQGVCKIDVTLLIAKSGPLGIDELEGRSMTCLYPIGVAEFPEKNLDLCHGRLKEELQRIIIEKLHEYVLDNLEKIEVGLGGI
jgi:hypothetical protein